MANISVTEKELFTIRSALRVLIADQTVHYDSNPTKKKLEEINNIEKLLKKLGEQNGKL
jgi:hypothetical protein